MADNSVTLVGNITRDPELRYTAGGQGVASFGLAVSRRYQVNGEWQEKTSFFNVVAWGTTRRERRRVAQQGHRGSSSPAASSSASTTTREGEKRTVDRGRRRRDRPEPALGHAPRSSARPAPTSGGGQRWQPAGGWRRPTGGGRPAAEPATAATKSRSEPLSTHRFHRGHHDDQQEEQGAGSQGRSPSASSRRRPACSSPSKVEYIDYKDINLLHRFLSRPLEDPQPPRHRQRRAAAARDRQRGQERP